MNLIQRIKAAFNPRSPLRAVTLFPSWAQETPQWIMQNEQAFIDEGFNLNALIYAAIMYKARAAAGVSAYAYRGSRDEPEPLPYDTPLARFCDRPNAFMSWAEMQMVNEVFFNLFGNAYCAIVKLPNEIRAYPLRPDWVYHIYDRKKQTLLGYTYCPTGTNADDAMPVLASDMLHVRLPNPGDTYGGMGKGLSPLYPLSRSGDVDNAATAFLKLFFDNGAMPPGILTTEQQIDENTAGMLRERWTATYGNYRNWHEPVVLGAGASYQRTGLTFNELDLTALDARNESRIVMPFGVPLNLVESRPSIVQSTYSNKEQDRRMFWEDTMLPELRGFEVEWSYYLRDDASNTIAYDYGDIPALVNVRIERAESFGKAFDRGALLLNEYRAALNMPPLPPDQGDVLKLPLMVQLVGIGATPAPAAESGAAASEDEAPKQAKARPRVPRTMTLEQKRALYDLLDAKAVSLEPLAASAAANAFETDRRVMLALIRDAQVKAYQAKATVAWQQTLLDILAYIESGGKENWRETFAPVFEVIVTERDETLATTFGVVLDVRALQAEEWFQDYTMTFADEIADTNAEQLKALLEKALAEGWSVNEMEQQLNILFDVWITGESPAMAEWALERSPIWRRELIARDQTVRAANAGAFELYQDWGVAEKEWFATPDDRTRDAHRIGAAWGQAPVVVPIDAPFRVGGEDLMYPGDPAGSPENVIQCRCTSLPVIPD